MSKPKKKGSFNLKKIKKMMISVIPNLEGKAISMIEKIKAVNLHLETRFLSQLVNNIIITRVCTIIQQMKIVMKIKKMKVG